MVSLKLGIMLSVWSDLNYFDQIEIIQCAIYNSWDILVITFPQNVTFKDKNDHFKLRTNMGLKWLFLFFKEIELIQK